jgi:hypothetical protein
MDNGHYERRTLSIPSFASERCRGMTAELLRTLAGIAPTDDKALEDRALACFVVACGELALMNDIVHRDTVVAQLSAAARKLVDAAAPPNTQPREAVSQEDAREELPEALPQELPQESAQESSQEFAREHAQERVQEHAQELPQEIAQELAQGLAQGLAQTLPPDLPEVRPDAHLGMTWEELEAVLKREKEAKNAGRLV